MPETNNKEVGTNIAFDAIRIGLASPEKNVAVDRQAGRENNIRGTA